jgi:hypothetical protein
MAGLLQRYKTLIQNAIDFSGFIFLPLNFVVDFEMMDHLILFNLWENQNINQRDLIPFNK